MLLEGDKLLKKFYGEELSTCAKHSDGEASTAAKIQLSLNG